MAGYLKLSDFSTRGIEQLKSEIVLQITNYINENDIGSGSVSVDDIVDALTITVNDDGKAQVNLPLNTSDVQGLDELIIAINDSIANLFIVIGDKSNIGHQHVISDIDGLQDGLDEKATTTEIDAKLNDYYVNVSDNVMGLFTRLEVHEKALINTEDGLHGVRIWNGKVQQTLNDGISWEDAVSTIDATTLQIPANNVTESSSRVFVTVSEQATITSNANEIGSHSLRIGTLETTVNGMNSTDEKVKMDSTSTSNYLIDLVDGVTLQNTNGKLIVKSIDGITATNNELNMLQGVKSNLQAQLDALSSIGNFTTSVTNYTDLSLIPSPTIKDMVIVTNDENNDDSSTIYIYNGTDWIFTGEFRGGEIRDFSTNPIDLSTETAGVLPKSKYEKPIASEIMITDANGNLTSLNVEDAFAELFTYANNIKSIANIIGSPLSISDTSAQMNSKMQQLKLLFANYLTQKGVVAYPYNTLEELINKVLTISNITIEGTIKKLSKLNVSAPYDLRIVLDEALSLSDITATLIEFVQGATGIVHYDIGFDNGDASDFEPNEDVEFDGKMKLKTKYTLDMEKDNSWISGGALFRKEVDKNEWLQINSITVKE